METIEHTEKHTQLHAGLDELVADFITCTGRRLLNVTIMELIRWSFGQTVEPTEVAQDGN